MTMKLQQYKPTDNCDIGPICGDNNWAVGLLGLRSGGLAVPHHPQQSLEVELTLTSRTLLPH